MVKPDYAKWMLDDPRINFAISKRGLEPGVDHLGLQVESDTELNVAARASGSGGDCRGRPDQCGVLLCAVRQVLDNRSPGDRLGNFSHARLNSSVW